MFRFFLLSYFLLRQFLLTKYNILNMTTTERKQHIAFIKESIEELVGRRFKGIRDIEKALFARIGEDVHIFKSEDEKTDEADFSLDGEVVDAQDFTLYYLLDNSGKYYITEVSLF